VVIDVRINEEVGELTRRLNNGREQFRKNTMFLARIKSLSANGGAVENWIEKGV